MLDIIRRLWKEEEGQGLVEYGLIIALIAILLIGSLTGVKDWLADVFAEISGTAVGE